jgi:hypothetical protein
MATDHMWNSMENVRIAKSQIGTGMMLAGAAIASHNDRKDRHDKALVGIGIMAAGALMRAGARADTRHCDVLPQRVYLVPLYLSDPTAQVELQVQGAPGSRIVLSGLGAPKSKLQAQLRYIQLVNSRNAAPPWAVSGQVYYDSDQIAVDGKAARSPYIVGGYSVAPPSDDVLDRYQGNLGNFTLAELNDLYREEGIKWTIEDEGGWADQHVLEGGKSLVAPLPGTVGFARLFGQLHQPHQARSSKVRALVVTPN